MKVAGTKRFVLDASIALAWFFTEESTSYTEAVFDLILSKSEALVPAIWPFEVANAFLIGERRKRLTFNEVTGFLQRLASLPIKIDQAQIDRAFGQILSVARHEQLTEYDAAYLELASREALPLATLDQRLQRAAQQAGVPLVTV
ncbi:MAG TPA: type II toxin-antitoxin system VapC family toxin [Terriglobales bacterium]|jgi:predicted nucleic acid-binding protein|nr:type II toxin-antitoxin system VapC family toxin [Terriglobales bacterium]